MPVYKSVQYSIYCDLCDNMEDYAIYETKREAEEQWRSLGWHKTKRGWECPLHNKKNSESMENQHDA